jgi:hypothetical protein
VEDARYVAWRLKIFDNVYSVALTAKSMWESQGLNSLVEDAMAKDRVGYAILESIFRRKASTLQDLTSVLVRR